MKNSHDAVGKLPGGWQVTGVTQFQTGTPSAIGTNADFPGIGSGDFKPWNVSGDAGLLRGDRKFSESTADDNFWFRPRNTDGSTIFTIPTAGTFSTVTTSNTG